MAIRCHVRDWRKQLPSAHLSGINIAWRQLHVCSWGVISSLMKSEGSMKNSIITQSIKGLLWTWEKESWGGQPDRNDFSCKMLFCMSVFFPSSLLSSRFCSQQSIVFAFPRGNNVQTSANLLKVFCLLYSSFIRWGRRITGQMGETGWQATMDLKPCIE